MNVFWEISWIALPNKYAISHCLAWQFQSQLKSQFLTVIGTVLTCVPNYRRMSSDIVAGGVKGIGRR
jgi:hypothetical protein